jgi:hypothetical protein
VQGNQEQFLINMKGQRCPEGVFILDPARRLCFLPVFRSKILDLPVTGSL